MCRRGKGDDLSGGGGGECGGDFEEEGLGLT